jgi:hypothetical protein
VHAYQTPGGQWRIPPAGVEAILQGSGHGPPATATSNHSASQPSTILRQKKEHVEELNLTLQEKRAKIALQELDAEQRERAEQQDAAQRAREQQEKHMRQDSEAAGIRRRHDHKEAQREERAARARLEWESHWLRLALTNVPSELTVDVQHAVRQSLSEMYEYADDVVAAAVRATVEKALTPWRRAQAAATAANEARNQLSFFARGYGGTPSEWELRATESAKAAIAKLPETATLEQMISAARTAGKSVYDEYLHSENCRSALVGIEGRIAGLLRSASSQEKAKAEHAVRTAFAGLPVGASKSEFDAARDAALESFIAAETQRRSEREVAAAEERATREAVEAKARLESEADTHLYRVNSYLGELQAKPDGWDFEGQQYKYAQEIKQEIRPTLIEYLPLDLTAGRERVEDLVDEWLANHWNPSNAV